MTEGSMAQMTRAFNTKAFEKILIQPRHLIDVSNITLQRTINITGETVAFPIGIAPTAFHTWFTPDGELATVRAAKNTEVVYIASMDATTKLEEIAKAEPKAMRWQQMYIFEDRDFTKALLKRAEKAEVAAIVLTIDKPVGRLNWQPEIEIETVQREVRGLGANYPQPPKVKSTIIILWMHRSQFNLYKIFLYIINNGINLCLLPLVLTDY